jgi:hypothetical protein
MQALLSLAAHIPPGAPAGRFWLDRLGGIVPGPAATRWLLLADLGVIALVVAQSRRPSLAAPAAAGAGLLALNVLGMLFTDFFLGLAAFHVLVALAGLLAAGRARAAGAALLGLALGLGVLT